MISLIKSRTIRLHEEVHYPSSEIQHLKSIVRRLDGEVSALKRLVATKEEVRNLRDGVNVPISALNRAVRKYEKREEWLRLSAEERFDLVESRLEEMLRLVFVSIFSLLRVLSIERKIKHEVDFDHWVSFSIDNREISINSELIDHLKITQESSPITHIFKVFSHLANPNVSKYQQYPDLTMTSDSHWFERGPFFYVFFPLNVSNMALSWVGKGVGYLGGGNKVKMLENGKEEKKIRKEHEDEQVW
jgi:hypothetical protein